MYFDVCNLGYFVYAYKNDYYLFRSTVALNTAPRQFNICNLS